MITLIRLYIIKVKEIKYKLVMWNFVDKLFTELLKNPQEIEQKIMDSIVKMIIGDKSVNDK